METPRICFTLEQALKTKLPNCFDTFIVQNEDRKFLVFKSIEDYLERRDYYNNCHEVVIFKDNKAQGRLVFDFDYKNEHMTSDFPVHFCSEVEDMIKIVFKKYYNKYPNMKFIWLKCENKKKISFHLIVKGAYFVDDWKNQMLTFYTFMQDEMKNRFHFYNEEYLDKAIARINATLRMPFNSKKGGNPMLPYFECEEKPFDFYDGLIGVYRQKDMEFETKIKTTDLIQEKEDKEYKYEDFDFDPEDVYRQFQTMNDGIFKMGSVDGQFLTLLRKKASQCLVDKNRHHEHDNSYLVVNKFGIFFGCHRGCSYMGKKLILVKKFEAVVPVEEKPCDAFLLAEKNWKISKWFVQSKINGKYVNLKRVNPGKCCISIEPHETDDAYLVVNDGFVHFGCSNKNCVSAENKKTKFIGKL